jgi:hypothetical protein
MKTWQNLLLSFAIAVSASARANASEWINIGPIVSGDVRAFVDYQVEHSVPPGDIWQGQPPQGPASFRIAANPLWVNVLRSGLSRSDHVLIQLISYDYSCYRGECSNVQRISETAMAYAEAGRFTVQLPALTLNYQLNDGYALTRRRAVRHELVIWINGVLYKDTNGRNLSLTMPERN